MGKSFFNKIVDLIDGMKNESENSAKHLGKDGIDTEENLLNAIVQVFNKVYKGKKIDLTNKIFTLWVADQLIYDNVEKQDFFEQLTTRLDDEGYMQTVWNKVRLERPPQDNMFTKVTEHIFLQMESIEVQKPAAREAKITVVPGKGSLLQEAYLLNSEECKHYNIGVGILPDMRGKGSRENHIAIDDNVDSSQYEHNKYVSRAHAHIGFSDKYGFFLQVEAGGSRVYSGRTQILRKDKAPIEVENLELPIPLENGDLIVLSKAVVLRYEEVSNH